ncbi:AAA15 family ATPase/GTPase [Algoriphagus sp. 4150]|uniref:AAA family ATPase n=1 Tax=Algoriphagus sp. 4150 TaxID=2817756 RepID=UPI0028585E94|nr:ATP-binding protein [Algoriphagus sp. 4150]MDR7128098.1 AAA15 family ATPase/GTPase [Algoriphagus sp. 4150]
MEDFPKLSLLKALALFGANASGKTNLIKAISFTRDFVLNSAKQDARINEIEVEPYKLLVKSQNEPSQFEVEFITNGQRFKYGFSVDKKKVWREYLYLILKTTEKLYFERIEEKIELSPNFSEGYGKQKFVKSQSLFLSTLAQLNGVISTQIFNWFNNLTVITETNFPSFTGYTAQLFGRKKSDDFLLSVFKGAGFDFDGVAVRAVNIDENLLQFFSPEIKELVRKNSPKQYQIFTSHKVYDLHGQVVDEVEFDLKEESAGTQKFFSIAGPIINSLQNGYPIIIDEMDARLHFHLVRFIIRLFCSESFNSNGSQLVFINQMTDIMDRKLLRRDQILLISRTKMGTELNSILKEGARADKSFKNDYLNGEFGAIPDIEFNQLGLFG